MSVEGRRGRQAPLLTASPLVPFFLLLLSFSSTQGQLSVEGRCPTDNEEFFLPPTSACETGTAPVLFRHKCIHAAQVLGLQLDSNILAVTRDGGLPKGCFYKVPTREMFWNSIGKQDDHDIAGVQAICWKGSRVVAWGADYGNDTSKVEPDLVNVAALYSNRYAFAALKVDGSVVTWGLEEWGGDSMGHVTEAVQDIAPARYGFAALGLSGRVMTWGTCPDPRDPCGVDISSVAEKLSSGVISVSAADSAFAALKDTGEVVAWGSPNKGGDVLSAGDFLSSDIVSIYPSVNSFAAIHRNGSCIAWGKIGTSSAASVSKRVDHVVSLASTPTSYAALLIGGKVTTWGSVSTDTSSVAHLLSSGVVGVTGIGKSSQGAFAAWKEDGSVVAWGGRAYGGDSSSVGSDLVGVKGLVGSTNAFAAVRQSYTSGLAVIAWGNSNLGGNATSVAGLLSGHVSRVYPGATSFAALLNTGRVVTWGEGTIPTNIQHYLSANVSSLCPLHGDHNAFTAVRLDGRVLTWGQAGPGNVDIRAPSIHASSQHLILASTSAAFALGFPGPDYPSKKEGWSAATAAAIGFMIVGLAIVVVVSGPLFMHYRHKKDRYKRAQLSNSHRQYIDSESENEDGTD